MSFTITEVAEDHRLTTRTGSGLDLVVMSGTAVCEFRGTGPEFNSDEAHLTVGPRWLRINEVAPMAALASWYDDRTAVNAGIAIRSCTWTRTPADPGGDQRIRLVVSVEVSDTDAILYRFAYSATAVGVTSADQSPGPGEGSIFS